MYIFIVNPNAGNGRAKRVFSKIAKSSLYKEIDKTYFLTQYVGHAEEIASELQPNYPEITCLIVIGGDGTVHEVLNGLDNQEVTVAFIPGGSGNDFARGCQIKGNPVNLFQQIVKNPEELPYWLGDYEADDKIERKFINSMGFGFDACITHTANNSIYKKVFSLIRLASLSYAITLIHMLFRFKPMDVELMINNEKRIIRNSWMVTIANHPFYGGGMKIIPNATIQPGTFSILILHSISKLKVLALFLTVFSGKHINFKEVELIEAQYMTITADNEIYYQVDGQTDSCSTCTLSKQMESISITRPGLLDK
ncbi:diacylglycerol kinase family lipid kinase [Virgibacillus necropolis]|uniref:diacylglycerol/lipid kinase family protein n=1 Tax=Virgibacillus necropolis TaxID=163877 RepID=UPI00384BC7CD